ncbi:MAG: glycosyltransferase [Proteobacteria bacterium]|nr:glycosyltransferase [Pseudomonadota bacterium]
MPAPDVSIIVPCYNAARTVAATLASALAQTGPSFELIVVDDGSTDHSAALIADYQAQRPDVVRVESGPNRGAAAARNRGIALARGRFLLFLDADDRLRPGTLGARVDALAAAGDDIAYTDWQQLIERADGTCVPGAIVARPWQAFHANPEIAIARGFWAPPAALLYTRACVERTGGFDGSLLYIEDGRYMFHAVRRGARMRHVPGVGADYYMAHANRSESRRDPGGVWRNMVVYGKEIEATWRQEGELGRDQAQALLWFLGRAARHLYVDDRAAFHQTVAAMRMLDPSYIPHPRASMRAVARVIGYPRSEAVALAARTVLARFRRSGR